MNRCESLGAKLIERVYDELPAHEHARLDEHLAACPRCRDHLAELVAGRELLQAAEVDKASRLSAPLIVSWARQQESQRRTAVRRVLGTVATVAALVVIAASLGVRLEADRQQIRLVWQAALPKAETAAVEKRDRGWDDAAYRRLLHDWDTPHAELRHETPTIVATPIDSSHASYLHLRQELTDL
ncbi:MAG: zf-HC2 domain-containing protein [Planctomycetaceae bacterium]|nr:zf-HC2 domain-containing protein [Planctomycetaceae bacterium]